MTNRINRRIKNFNPKNSYTKKNKLNFNYSEINKKERSRTMKHLNLKEQGRKLAFLILTVMIISQSVFTGCSDSNLTGPQSSGMNNSSPETGAIQKDTDSTKISLNMSLKYKSVNLKDSKYLESNNGNSFNNIVSISRELKPYEAVNLDEIQPYGIFGIYISSNGLFNLSNSDGMTFSAKTVLLEKCSFIDLKIQNLESGPINITGYVAGE